MHREILLIKSNRNQIVFTIYQSENVKYNLISGWFNEISKTISLCAEG